MYTPLSFYVRAGAGMAGTGMSFSSVRVGTGATMYTYVRAGAGMAGSTAAPAVALRVRRVRCATALPQAVGPDGGVLHHSDPSLRCAYLRTSKQGISRSARALGLEWRPVTFTTAAWIEAFGSSHTPMGKVSEIEQPQSRSLTNQYASGLRHGTLHLMLPDDVSHSFSLSLPNLQCSGASSS